MYKIIYENMIIDVMKKPKYCKYIQRANRTLLCDKMSANCIVSSDGSQVYHIVGTLAMPTTYKSVDVVAIDQDEYNYLCSLTIPVKVQQAQDELDDPIVLQQRVNELKNEVEMLTSCILEMSTIIYS